MSKERFRLLPLLLHSPTLLKGCRLASQEDDDGAAAAVVIESGITEAVAGEEEEEYEFIAR